MVRQLPQTGTASRFAEELLSTQLEPLARCEYLIESRRPFGLIMGPAGTGKSDLLGRISKLRTLTRGPVPIAIDVTGVSVGEFLAVLSQSLDVAPADRSFTGVLDLLTGGAACGQSQVLLLDHLDDAGTDLVPLLSRLLRETAASHSLTILAAVRSLDRADIAQLQQDFGWLRIDLTQLSAESTSRVTRSRINEASAAIAPLDVSALRAIFTATQGNAGQLRRLTDLIELASSSEETGSVSERMVQDLAQELAIAPAAR